jgi:hypothetical protein
MRVYQFRHVGTETTDVLPTQKQTPQSNDYGASLLNLVANYFTAEISQKRVVPTEGLEPPHPKAHGPEPCASTNSATWAIFLLPAFPPTSAIILAFEDLRQTNFCCLAAVFKR